MCSWKGDRFEAMVAFLSAVSAGLYRLPNWLALAAAEGSTRVCARGEVGSAPSSELYRSGEGLARLGGQLGRAGGKVSWTGHEHPTHRSDRVHPLRQARLGDHLSGCGVPIGGERSMSK